MGNQLEGIDRIYQEFPNHNWLENKYLNDNLTNQNDQEDVGSDVNYESENGTSFTYENFTSAVPPPEISEDDGTYSNNSKLG